MDIVVWGTGKWFHENYERIAKIYNVVAITDNDSSKWNQCIIDSFVCEKPSDILADKRHDTFLIAVINSFASQQIKNHIYKYRPNANIYFAQDSFARNFELSDSKYETMYKDTLGNEVYFGQNVFFKNIQFYFHGCNNKVCIGDNVYVEERLNGYFGGDNNQFQIGDNTTIVSLYIDLSEGRITIGEDCMFSSDIEIYQNPTHPFFDGTTLSRINYGKDVIIGNHVWCGKRAGLISGFQIGDNSIIGYGTISSGKFDSNMIIAGNPARIVRQGIVWKRDGIGQYNINNILDSHY